MEGLMFRVCQEPFFLPVRILLLQGRVKRRAIPSFLREGLKSAFIMSSFRQAIGSKGL
jgi:hypothetical protein